MPRSVPVAVGVSAILTIAWLSNGCGSSDHPSSIASAGAVNEAGAPSASAGMQSLNLGGLNGSSAGSGNGGPLTDSCAADVSTAQAVPLDMYIMLDTSGSMLDSTSNGTSKWDSVKSALESFLKDSGSAGLGVGLQYFPVFDAPKPCTRNADCGEEGCFLKFCSGAAAIGACQTDLDCVNPSTGQNQGPCVALGQCSKNTDYVCSSLGSACAGPMNQDFGTCGRLTTSLCIASPSCDVTQYAAPATPIAVLPGAAAGLVASIDSQMPGGQTPTEPALSGAIQQASTWAKANPSHRVVVVLATDGLPTVCPPLDIASVAALASTGLMATPSISTFVIGVFGSADVTQGAPANLDQIAQQGGTKSAFIVDTQQDVATQFRSALDAIRGSRLACQFQIPQPSGTQILDYGRVNVQFKTAGDESTLFHVSQASDCDPMSGGWYYDVDPQLGMPTRIIACPTSCSALEAAASGSSVGIALGCTTLVR